MKAILDRFDFVTTWWLIMLGAGVFITGFGFGAVVADKTTPRPICKCAIHSTPISVDSLKAP